MTTHRAVYDWTQETRDKLIVLYNGKREMSMRIAKELGTKVLIVEHEAARLGLSRVRYYVKWSDKEREYIADNANRFSPTTLANRLSKSVNAVITELKRQRLHRRYKVGWYDASEVSRICGYDNKWAVREIAAGRLRATRQIEHQWRIEEKEFKRFLIYNVHRLMGRNIDLVIITDILARNGQGIGRCDL